MRFLQELALGAVEVVIACATIMGGVALIVGIVTLFTWVVK